jgi:uncharacterized membrane protein
MPNLDGGHYFYTGLFPVCRDPVKREDGSITIPLLKLREALATLPNFSQVPEGDDPGGATDRLSPFARCRRTHFARFAVMDDPAYNGRDPTDAVKNAALSATGKGVDPLVHQPVDHFSRPWLLFATDFDAHEEADRDRWAEGLWDVMEPELRAVFANCGGFHEVHDRAGFAAYLRHGQLETTMSFNDYYIDPPAFAEPVKGILVMAGLLFAAIAAASIWLRAELDAGWPLIALGVVIALAAAIWLIYRQIMKKGALPFPTAPDSNLPSVLKGIYLRQKLTSFAIAQQGAEPEALHAAFGDFLRQTRPGDVAGPTQAPGVLRS